MPPNYGAREDSWEPLGLQGYQSSQSWGKSILNTHWKDWCWSWNSSILVIWYEQVTHWRSPWYWQKLRGRRRGLWRMMWLVSVTNAMDMNLGKLQEMVRNSNAWCVAVHGVAKSDTTGHLNTTTTTVQEHQFFNVQPSLWSNIHIYSWLLEKPYLWLDGPLLAK